jgi:hypothetical protein
MGLHEEFNAWLSSQGACGLAGNPEAGPEAGAFEYKIRHDHHTVIRVEKREGFGYLYCQRVYGYSGIVRGEKFDYAGIYCKRDGLVYDGQHGIEALLEPQEAGAGRSAKRLRERLGDDVRRAVEAAIGNDRKNVPLKLLDSKQDLENLDHFVKYQAAAKARELFLSGADASALEYRCAYCPPEWTEDTLLDYISGPEGYAAREAEMYLKFKQDAILTAFLENSAVAKELIALGGNPRCQAHRVRGIMEAMRGTDAKTVRVTIRKDGQELTFKTEADQFRRDCGSYYSTWRIEAAGRREFERLFGRGDYGPEHVLRIEYGRAVLYEAGVAAA